MNKLLFVPLVVCGTNQYVNAQSVQSPNIVLILCDDMGFSDLGCYGSEIQTPNIDKLAQEGIRFSQFKNTGRSCPSRASMLTGRYQHEVGMGWMAEADEHRPGYRGQIDKEYPTIAEVMKSGGYSTYMSGKWHVTTTGGYESLPMEVIRYKEVSINITAAWRRKLYKPSPVYNNLEKVTYLPDDYYYTQAITDSAVSYVQAHDTRKPMFFIRSPLRASSSITSSCRICKKMH